MDHPLKSLFISMFFRPSRESGGNPADDGIGYEDVTFPAKDGEELSGFLMRPRGPSRGVVIHCHGNSGNIHTQHVYAHLFVRAGFEALSFDYRGYGKSPGKPTPDTIIEDTLSAIKFIQSLKDLHNERIILFGQSLGGAAAAGAMKQDHAPHGLILEGTFTTYREMAWKTTRGRLLFFFTNWAIPNKGPLIDIGGMGEKPVLIIHGKEDDLIPASFGEALFKAAPTPHKSLTLLNNLGHLDGKELPEYEGAIHRFLDRHFV